MTGGKIEIASFDWTLSPTKLGYVCTYYGTHVLIYVAYIEELSPMQCVLSREYTKNQGPV